jgi:hypothetical protein
LAGGARPPADAFSGWRSALIYRIARPTEIEK